MTKEQIYDEQIHPLMLEIVKMCQEHQIPLVAAFHIPNLEEEGLTCTTAILPTDSPGSFRHAHTVLAHNRKR